MFDIGKIVTLYFLLMLQETWLEEDCRRLLALSPRLRYRVNVKSFTPLTLAGEISCKRATLLDLLFVWNQLLSQREKTCSEKHTRYTKRTCNWPQVFFFILHLQRHKSALDRNVLNLYDGHDGVMMTLVPEDEVRIFAALFWETNLRFRHHQLHPR